MKLGILGGGQLGRMLALAAYPLGIQCRILEPAAESSASQVAERIRGEYEDFRTLYDFAKDLDAITYEFENVPVESLRWLSERLPVWPPVEALATAQDRIAEKTFFSELGIPVARFASVTNRDEFEQARDVIGLPGVLKTTRFGYDGKGQMVLKSLADCDRAWQLLGGRNLIWEEFIPFDRELSIIAVRSVDGAFVAYPIVQNEHRSGILRKTIAPAPHLSTRLQEAAEKFARIAMNELNYVGVLAIELFERNGQLYVNEMAPRVHNSGHWTIEGAATSQFQNHVRAVLGLPLGNTNLIQPTVMLNCIGRIPDIREVLAYPGAMYHHYGKKLKPGRKVGHISFLNPSSEVVSRMVENFLQRFKRQISDPE